jgi:hypothetical protein
MSAECCTNLGQVTFHKQDPFWYKSFSFEAVYFYRYTRSAVALRLYGDGACLLSCCWSVVLLNSFLVPLGIAVPGECPGDSRESIQSDEVIESNDSYAHRTA